MKTKKTKLTNVEACPFCKNPPVLKKWFWGGYVFTVNCGTVGCAVRKYFPSENHNNEDDAIEEWNDYFKKIHKFISD